MCSKALMCCIDLTNGTLSDAASPDVPLDLNDALDKLAPEVSTHSCQFFSLSVEAFVRQDLVHITTIPACHHVCPFGAGQSLQAPG